MSHLLWLDQERLNRIMHMFPKPHGVARVDDRRILILASSTTFAAREVSLTRMIPR